MQKLTATAVKQAKPKDKPYKLADGGGLYLHVKPNGKYFFCSSSVHNSMYRGAMEPTWTSGVYPWNNIFIK